MYAVIETGGKQYRVELGTELEVERLDVEPGQSITLDRVLLVADGDDATIGRPLIGDATVSAEVVRQDRADKLIVFKYRPKARRRVKRGHRQEQTVLRVSDITFGGRSAADDARKAERARKTERERLEEAAARQAAEDAALAAKLEAQRAPAEKKPSTERKGATPAKVTSTSAKATSTSAKATSTSAKATATSAKATSGTTGAAKTRPGKRSSAKAPTTPASTKTSSASAKATPAKSEKSGTQPTKATSSRSSSKPASDEAAPKRRLPLRRTKKDE